MEGGTRNSRSHFRQVPQPPSSTAAGTGYYMRGFGNGAAVVSGGNGFTTSGDVFGGPPRFGAMPFAPRAEDYSEIFGTFRSSRSSSIPMLDLPPVDDSVAAFEVVGSSGVEYSDIFGGFDFGAASYHDLFRRSDGTEESSDDAWSNGTESPSGESPYASSGRNKYFCDGEFREAIKDKVFDFSYNNVKLGSAKNLEHFYEPQPSSFPVYTYEIEGSDVRKESEERYSCAVGDDIILCEDSSGNISVQAQRRTKSPHLPPVSDLPHMIFDWKKNPASSTSDYEQSKTNTIETFSGGGSFDFIDVELSAGSSSIASAAAIKEATDSAKDTLFTTSDLNSDEKLTMIFEEAVSRADETHLKDERESNGVKTSGDSVPFSSNTSEVLPDPLQFQDVDSKAAEPAQEKVTKNQRLSMDPVLTEGDGEWKVTTECFELVNNGNPNAEFNQLDVMKSTVQKLEQEVGGNDVFIYEGSESPDEACNPRDNRRRLRGKKIASRNGLHEKMAKLVHDFNEASKVSGQTMMRLEGDETTQNFKMHHVRRFDQAADQVYYDRNQNEGFYLAGCEENAVVSDCSREKLKESLEVQNIENHDLATGNTSSNTMNAANKDGFDAYEEPMQTDEFENPQMDDYLAINEEKKTKSEVDLLFELKTADRENSISAGPSMPDEAVNGTAHENQELKSSNLSSSPDFTSTSGERIDEDLPINKEKSDSRSADLNGETDNTIFCKSIKQTQNTEANQPQMSERKQTIQRVGIETKAVIGDAAAEDKETANKLRRKEESDQESVIERQLEKERESEAKIFRKPEEMEKERERLRKLDEERERERERQKDRMEVKMSVERAALEREAIETRQRAMAEARERLEKACAEAREKSEGKTFKDSSQLRAERVAVERATAEARAMEKAMADGANFKVERSVSDKFSSSFRNVDLKNCSSSSDLWNSDKPDGVEGESSQRCRARSESHRRTGDRGALAALKELDLIAQREQAERNRLAETLDADIKRWSNGKEGDLRALLSTLQYILGSDSGWQSITLTEVITSTAVKKAYRKATLFVHPDKQKQRGTTIRQKYIREKVFDLLRDAWNRFNSEEN